MTATQRVDVERFDPCISRERSDARHVYPTPDMEHAAFGEYVKYEDYAALLQQLAEAERDNETMRGADYHQAGVEQEQEIIDLESKLAERDAEIEALHANSSKALLDKLSAAERAREECVKLAERWERISATHGVRCFTGDDHLIFANELRVALGQQPAAFLAANGGRDE